MSSAHTTEFTLCFLGHPVDASPVAMSNAQASYLDLPANPRPRLGLYQSQWRGQCGKGASTPKHDSDESFGDKSSGGNEWCRAHWLKRQRTLKGDVTFSLSICQGQALLIIHFWFSQKNLIKGDFHPRFLEEVQVSERAWKQVKVTQVVNTCVWT